MSKTVELKTENSGEKKVIRKEMDVNELETLIKLDPKEPCPTAEDIFHLRFFDEELPKLPTHYRMQRWNKRRISKRWTWKKGRDREIYEQRAAELKKKWLKLKENSSVNNENKDPKTGTLLEYAFKSSKKRGVINLSTPSIAENQSQSTMTPLSRINLMSHLSQQQSSSLTDRIDVPKPRLPTVDTRSVMSGSNLSTVTSEESDDSHVMNTATAMSASSSSLPIPGDREQNIEGRRKHTRVREQLIARIASGDTFAEDLSRALKDKDKKDTTKKLKSNSKAHLMFNGIINSKTKTAKKKKRNRNKNNFLAPMKLQDFLDAAENFSHKDKEPTKHSVMNSSGSGIATSSTSMTAVAPNNDKNAASFLSVVGRSSINESGGNGRSDNTAPNLEEIQLQQTAEFEKEKKQKQERSREMDDAKQNEQNSAAIMATHPKAYLDRFPKHSRAVPQRRIITELEYDSDGFLSPRSIFRHQMVTAVGQQTMAPPHVRIPPYATNDPSSMVAAAAVTAAGYLGVNSYPHSHHLQSMSAHPHDSLPAYSDMYSRMQPRTMLHPHHSPIPQQFMTHSVQQNPFPYENVSMPVYDHMTFRRKCIQDVANGSTVFMSVPRTNEATDTVLCAAPTIYQLFPLAKNGLKTLEKHISNSFGLCSVLSIQERAYFSQPCQPMVLIQFRHYSKSRNMALAFYHAWVKKSSRIEFVENWFSRAYFTRHMHYWSEYSAEHLPKQSEKALAKGRHCQCMNNQKRWGLSGDGLTSPPQSNTVHNENCVHQCCCCIHIDNEFQPSNQSIPCIKSEIVVLWHGQKCSIKSAVANGGRGTAVNNTPDGSPPIPSGMDGMSDLLAMSSATNNGIEEYCINTPLGIRVVPASSLQVVTNFVYSISLNTRVNNQKTNIVSGDGSQSAAANKENTESSLCISNQEIGSSLIKYTKRVTSIDDLSQAFDAQKQIWDDLTFASFAKRFWNIPTFL